MIIICQPSVIRIIFLLCDDVYNDDAIIKKKK